MNTRLEAVVSELEIFVNKIAVRSNIHLHLDEFWKKFSIF
jgi:hypothetical protein